MQSGSVKTKRQSAEENRSFEKVLENAELIEEIKSLLEEILNQLKILTGESI